MTEQMQWHPEAIYRPYPKIVRSEPCRECAWATFKRIERRGQCRSCLGTRRVGAQMKALLTEMREALVTAHEYENAGMHKTAYAYGQLAAKRIEQALAQGWGDNDQLTVKGDLARIPGPDVADSQIDWR